MERNDFMGTFREYGGRGLHVGLSTLGDFQKFLLRGNVIDLAVGVVIGAAFNGLVQGFVTDVISPLIAAFSDNKLKNLDGLQFSFPIGSWNVGPFLVGNFLTLLISFLITAAVVYFLVVKPFNILEDRYKMHMAKPVEPTTRDCPYCLSSVPLLATRCSYCTSQLPPANQQPSSAPTQR
ncbi:MAG TPA: MscL family protein [Dictyobacter sp.]|jgi:large conductance mechanosensitive channel|nr:MscL family protein [Dictyobacter sp.]